MPVGRDEAIAVVGGGRAQQAAHPEERDGHGEHVRGVVGVHRDGALERRVVGRGVDHRRRGRAGPLGVDRARRAGAGATHRDGQLVAARNDAVPGVGGHRAAERLVLTRGRVVFQNDHRERAGRHRAEAVGVDRLNGAATRKGDRRAQEPRSGVVRGDADDALARARGAGDVGVRAGVAGRGHHDDARADGVAGGDRGRVGGGPVGGTQRHVDDVHAVLDRPVDGFDGHVGAALAAEHAQGVQVGGGGDAGADLPGLGGGGRVVGAGVGRPGRVDAAAGGRAGHVRTVALAVQGVGVGDGHTVGGAFGVVVVADEVPAALDARGGGAEQRGVRRGGGRRLGGLERRDRARTGEVGVGVVDAGVDDRDLDARAREAGALPGLRHAEVGHAHGVVARVYLDGVHGLHPRRGGQRGDLAALHLRLDAVVGVLHLGEYRAAGRPRLVLNSLLLGAQASAHGLPLGRRQLASLLGLDHGHRVFGELDDHLDLGVPVQRLGDELGVDRAGGRLGEAVRSGRGRGLGGGEGGGDGEHRQPHEDGHLSQGGVPFLRAGPGRRWPGVGPDPRGSQGDLSLHSP